MRTPIFALILAAAALTAAGCQGKNILGEIVSGEGVCEDAVKFIGTCCQPQFDGVGAKHYDSCDKLNKNLSDDKQKSFYAYMVDKCRADGLSLIDTAGFKFPARDAASLTCDALLSNVKIPDKPGTDGDEEEEPELDELELSQDEEDEAADEGDAEPEFSEELEEKEELEPMEYDEIDLPDFTEIELVCEPLSVKCEGAFMRQCKSDGSGYKDAVECKDQNECTKDSCDSQKGCVFDKEQMNGESCSDVDVCFIEAKCDAGECKKTTQRDCSLEIPSHIDKQCLKPDDIKCEAAKGGCVFNYGANEGMACESANKCVPDAKCYIGKCAGETKNCSSVDGPCQTGYCDESDGQCKPSYRLEGDACQTGDKCFEAKKCDANHQCVGTAVNCDDGNDCTNDSCAPAEGCKHQKKQVGVGCKPTNKCVFEETAQCNIEGNCVGPQKTGTEADMKAVYPNASWSCLSEIKCDPEDGDLIFLFSGSKTCSDDNKCTVADFCDERTGACISGSALDCKYFDQPPCAYGKCDPAVGECQLDAAATGTPCQYGNPCTLNDYCSNGYCLPGPDQKDCDDDNLCTIDFCEESAPQGEDPCRHNPKNCGDNNDCTSDSCDALTGQCSNAALVGKPCDAGLVCDGVRQCVASGFCEFIAEPIDCSHLDEKCKMGVCKNSEPHCVLENKYNSTPCEDDNPDTVSDKCLSGVCAAGTTLPANLIDNYLNTFDHVVYCPAPNKIEGTVTVTLTISHQSPVDLKVSITLPDGMKKTILNQVPNPTTTTTVFTISDAAGRKAGGVWRLEINDVSMMFSGTLDKYTLDVKCQGVDYESEAEGGTDGDEESEAETAQ